MTIRNDATRLHIPQKDKRQPRAVVPRQGQVLLDTDIDQQSRLHLDRIELETRDSMGSPGRLAIPAGTTGFAITTSGQGDITIGAGHGYLDGWLLENPASCTLADQPHPWADPIEKAASLCVKAVVRHIDPVEEPGLADVALGDAQASGRSLIDWQVFRMETAETVSCATITTTDEWRTMTAPSIGTLAFIEQDVSPSTDPCSLSPGGGYSRYENLLYRIEVHGGDTKFDTPDGPRFGLHNLKLKMSRRNGSMMARIIAVSGAEVTVTPPSLDPRNWFAPGLYAEIVSIHDDVDPRAALGTERLFRVARASDNRITLQDVNFNDIGVTDDGTWFLRLWEPFPNVGNSGPGGIATAMLLSGLNSAPIDIGDGLAIQFSGGGRATFRRGDYWTCAARADGSIAWQKSGGKPVQMRAHGPEVRYAPLAILSSKKVEDCRIPLATLTDKALFYRGGDGQIVTIGAGNAPVTLPGKLRVGVMRGQTPVHNASVQWEFVNPSVSVGTINGAKVQSQTSTTGPDGLSEITWGITHNDQAANHQIKAYLPDAPGIQPIIFSARFDPATQQIGCSTYVIVEGSDWVATLRAIRPNENATVCFQRGTYETNTRVTLKGLGHITLSGAGEGTVIQCKSDKTALEFLDCESVTLHDLRVDSGDFKQKTKANGANVIPDRDGTVTIRNCPTVDVHATVMRCGGDYATTRTCLTIAGRTDKPMRSATVAGNRFLTGYAQDGVLVLDCHDVLITRNALSATKRSKRITNARLLNRRDWQKQARRHMVINPVVTSIANPMAKRIMVGKYVAEIESTIPQSEWDNILADNPIDAATIKDSAAFEAQINAMIAKSVANPNALPTLRRTLGRLATTGAPGVALPSAAVQMAMVAPAGIQVSTYSPAVSAGDGMVSLTVNAFSITFGSALHADTWGEMIKDVDPATIVKASDLELAIKRLANIYIANPKLPEIAGWYEDFGIPAETYSRQAITCGGARLLNVVVEDNRTEGFFQGVHIGVSVTEKPEQDDNKKLLAGPGAKKHLRIVNVRIAKNILQLRKPSPAFYAPSGIFLGNMETARIEKNWVAIEGADDGDRFQHGIRVWGELGQFLLISQNRISMAKIGIAVQPTNTIGDDYFPMYQWRATENLVEGVRKIDVIHCPRPLMDTSFNKPDQ